MDGTRNEEFIMTNVRKSRAAVLLARQIVAQIFEMKAPAGHHLVETFLAEAHGVSRTLVRAALHQLESDGVVELHKNRGYFLKSDWGELSKHAVEVPPAPEDELYRLIIADRLDQKLPDRVSQSALMDRYRPDRHILSRAMEIIVNEGIARKNKGQGWTFEPTISNVKSIQNSYDFRRSFEPYAMRIESYKIDTAVLDRLRAKHVAALEGDDLEGGPTLFDLDSEFHEALCGFTGNQFYVQAIQQQNRLRRLLEYRSYKKPERVRVWIREHIEIIDALMAKKIAEAALLMEAHLVRASAFALKQSENQTELDSRSIRHEPGDAREAVAG